MASACVNKISDNFLECNATSFPSYGWLSPRISFSRDFTDGESKTVGSKPASPAKSLTCPPEVPDLDVSATDFEFRLEDPVTMLPADELFSDGKLVPLQFSVSRPPVASIEARSPETPQYLGRNDVNSTDPYLFSPKAPRCSSRWRELLGLKKLYQNAAKPDNQKTNATVSNPNPKSIKHFLHKASRSSSDASLSLPLLRDSDSESVSISSRLSLSSSSCSSTHDHEDIPRLSLDSEKPKNPNPNPNPNPTNPPRVRLMKSRPSDTQNPNPNRPGRSTVRRTQQPDPAPTHGVSIDSPRMNSSGKIVFQSLERSSSSPSSFNGGPRFKHRGMERSYSANVRITPVLNVPVCSLRSGSSKSGGVFGFGQLFSSPQKKDGSNRGHHSSSGNSRNRTERT